ncbi:uncharacterized protein LOC125765788 [Anopheles funestus]|uniref:Uncharacterized protein n=1 Tax=Anopheles funestus TaxID=62324 RepID=A0A182R484_ANOFN|nr:uncharacterized protein LOC125765788 [Anopheles funestus]
MGLYLQHTVVLCFSLLWMPLPSTSIPCTIEVMQDMMSRLLKTEQTESGCEGVWHSLQAHLQQTHQNLTECYQREDSFKGLETPHSTCQPLLDEMEKQASKKLEMINADMQRKLLYEQVEIAKTRKEIGKLQKQLTSIQDEFKGFYQRLLLLHIHAGDRRRALHYYHVLVSLKEPNLLQTIVKFVYTSVRHENHRLENLLALVKYLPTKHEQMTLYRLIQPEIMNRTTQHFSFLAIIASLDMNKFVKEKEETEYKKLRDALFNLVMKRWQFQMLGGNYQDIVAFAKKYPGYFQKIGEQVALIYPKYWFQFSYSQYVTYPNLLPLPKQRLQAFRVIMRQIKQRNKTHFSYYLAKLAKQVDICEKYIKQHYDELKTKDQLIKLKQQFSDFDKTNGYEYYLKNVDKLTKTKPPIPANALRPKARDGRTGRR